MRAGRKRTPLSWITYTKDDVEHESDERENLWSQRQLEAMDQKFCRAVERARYRAWRGARAIVISCESGVDFVLVVLEEWRADCGD